MPTAHRCKDSVVLEDAYPCAWHSVGMQESCSYFNVRSLMGETGVKINLHTVLTKLLLPSPLLHFGAQAAPPSASRSRPKALALSAQVSLGVWP